MVGMSETQKITAISKVFSDSYKSPLSVIVVDNLERLLGESYKALPQTQVQRWHKERLTNDVHP